MQSLERSRVAELQALAAQLQAALAKAGYPDADAGCGCAAGSEALHGMPLVSVGAALAPNLVCSLPSRGGDGLKAGGAWGSGAAAALALGPAPSLTKAAISGSLAAIDALPSGSAEAQLLIPAVPGLSEPLVPAEAQAEAPTEEKKKVRSSVDSSSRRIEP